MTHTCFGEYCTITNSWDCLNRLDREKADKRTLEEIEKAREHTRFQIRMLTRSLDTKPIKCEECNGKGSVRIYEVSSGVSGYISVQCSDCNGTGKIKGEDNAG